MCNLVQANRNGLHDSYDLEPCEPSKQEIPCPIIRANRKLPIKLTVGQPVCCLGKPECYLGQSVCYFNRLTRVARYLADYPEWLQFCWDFVKPSRNDEIALQHFYFLPAAVQEFFSYFICAACNFFLPTSACRKFFQNHPPLPSRVKWSAPKTIVP